MKRDIDVVRRWTFCFVIAAAFWAAAAPSMARGEQVIEAARGEQPEAGGGLSAQPPRQVQSVVSRALGRDDGAYRVLDRGDVIRATNRRHGLVAGFGANGVRVRTSHGSLTLSLRAVGRGTTLRAVGNAVPEAQENRVEYRRRGLTEWYENGPLGLEQGFTVARREAGKRDGPLTLALGLSGRLVPRLDRDRRGLTLRGRDGRSPAPRTAGCGPAMRVAATCARGWSCAAAGCWCAWLTPGRATRCRSIRSSSARG